MQRDWCRSTLVLVRLLVQDGVELVVRDVGLVEDHVVVGWTSGTLDGGVGAQVEVILVRVSDTLLDERSRKRVAVAVAFLGEEADVVALATDNDHERDVEVRVRSAQELLHVGNLLLEDVDVLALGDTVADVHDALRELALTDGLHPVLDHGLEAGRPGVFHDHLNAEAVGLAGSSIAASKSVSRASDSRHGCSLCAWSRVRDVGTDDHGWDLELAERTSRGRADSTASRTAQLAIELHANVADVLGLALRDVSVLHALRDDAVATFSRALDTAVDAGLLVRQDENQDLRAEVRLVAGSVPSYSKCQFMSLNGMASRFHRIPLVTQLPTSSPLPKFRAGDLFSTRPPCPV